MVKLVYLETPLDPSGNWVEERSRKMGALPVLDLLGLVAELSG